MPAGQPSVGAHSPTGEARKVVTVVFADLAGSTTLQEQMDAESVRRVMDRFYGLMREPVEAHGGRIVKFIGDGVMAVFGVPTVAEDDAARAVKAAAAMHDAFGALAADVASERGARVGLRIGINTGEVVVTEGDDDVVGDAVNVAARLEHAAAEADVLVGEQTRLLTRDLFTYESVPPLDLKGKSEPVAAFRLASLTPPAAADASPFVGRQTEVDQLLEVFARTVEASRPQLVTVIGSPGLGKSRLAGEFCQRVSDRGSVLEGRCDPGGTATFAPVADVVRQAAGIDDTAAPDEVHAAIAHLFPDDDGDRERIATLAATVLGVGAPASPEETFWALRRIVERLASASPLVLVFDDVHWAEPMLLDLVEHLAEWTRGAPLLILALARPELRDVRPGFADPAGRPSAVLVLEPLDASAGEQLAAELLQGRPLPKEVAERLLRAAEGNPLFLRELVRMLIDDGVLRLEDGAWVTTAAATDIAVPPTIQALLSARIERLGSDERDVVERASVVGKQFFRGAVATLAPPPIASALDTHLETLRRKELVEPEGTYWVDEPVFRFHHSLIRDAAYRRLLKEARADLHERFAAWLVEKVGELVGEHEEVIGYHLEQAFGYQLELGAAPESARETGRRASSHLAAAARRALDRDDARSAAGLLERALLCLDPDDPARPELLLDHCEALLSSGDVVAGTDTVAALQVVADRSPRLSAWTEAYVVQLGAITDPANLRSWSERAGAAAEQLHQMGDAPGVAKAAAVHASILARLGQVAACEAALDRALAAAREASDRRRANAVLAGAPMAALWGPSPITRATGRCLDVARVLRITTGSPPVEAVALRAQAVLEAMRGRFDAARRLLGGSQRLLEELGQRDGLLHTELCAGTVELLADNAGAAHDALRRAYDGFRSLGVQVDAAQAAALLGRACLVQGRDGEALELSEESERLGGHDLKTSIAWRAVRAEALGRRGEHDEALRLAREAVAIAVDTDALVDHADARLALAAVLLAAGDDRGGAAEGQRAVELYEAKEASVRAAAARALVGGSVRSGDTHTLDGEKTNASHQPAGGAPLPANRATVLWEEYVRRFAQRDVDGVLALLRPEFVLEERQAQVLNRIEGHDAMRQWIKQFFAVDLDIEWEVVATRGEHFWLGRLRMPIRDQLGGEASASSLVLGEVDDGGLSVSTVMFDADDLDAAFDELDRRFAASVGVSVEELTRGERVVRESYATGDFDRWQDESFAGPDAVVVDHRPAGRGTITAAELCQMGRTMASMITDAEVRRLAIFRWHPPYSVARQQLRGRSTDGEDFELVYDVLAESDAGLMVRMEMYDPDDLERALARFDDLVNGGAGVARGPGTGGTALRAAQAVARALGDGDVDSAMAVTAPDCTVDDRRPVVGGVRSGGAEVRQLLDVVTSSPLVRCDVTPIATRGDGLALVEMTYEWAPTGGPSQVRALLLFETTPDGLVTAMVVFEPDDFDAALDELDQRFTAQLEPPLRPIFEAAAHGRRTYNARDWDGLRAVLAEDFRLVDHRTAGWGECDRDAYVERLRGMIELAPDVVLFHSESVRLSERHGVTTLVARGTHPEGGEFESALFVVAVFADGRYQRYEFFDPSKRAEALERCDELEGEIAGEGLGAGNLAVAGARRAAAALVAGDLDAVVATVAPDIVVDDRRSLVGSVQQGADEFRRVNEIMAQTPFRRADVTVVATRGPRLALARVEYEVETPWGGVSEVTMLRVDEADETGRAVRSVNFDADDLTAAFDELDRRFVELVDPSSKRMAELSAELRRAYSARDWDAYRTMLSDDLVVVDRRPAGWGECSGDEYLARIQALMDLAPDLEHAVIEHIRLAPSGGVAEVRAWGTDLEGGAFEMAFVTVGVLGDDGFEHYELFDASRREDAIARFEALAPAVEAPPPAAGVPRANAAVRVSQSVAEGLGAGDLDAVMAHHADDIVVDDRRPGTIQAVFDADELRAWISLGVEATDAVEAAFDPVATRGDRLALGQYTMRVRDRLGGVSEMAWLQITEIDDDEFVSQFLLFDPDDLDAGYEALDDCYAAQLPVEAQEAWALHRAGMAAYAARDWERYAAIAEPDALRIDHRPMGWGVFDLETYIRWTAEFVDMADDYALRSIEVTVEPGAVFTRHFGEGRASEGAPFVLPFFSVMTTAGGLLTSLEFYGVEQEADALARFREVTRLASAGPTMRRWDRFAAEMRVHHFEDIGPRLAPDYRAHDHRLGIVLDKTEEMEQQRRLAGTDGLSIAWEPVLDLGLLALARFTYHWPAAATSGPWAEMGSGETIDYLLSVAGDDGRFVATHRFADDQLHAALAVTEERYAAITADPAQAAAAGGFARLWRGVDAYNDDDWDALRAIYADDLVVVDHRPAGMGTIEGPDAFVAFLRGLADVSRERRWVIRELYHRGARSVVNRWCVVGTDEGGNPYELAYNSLVAVDDGGGLVRAELFATERLDDALARAAEIDAA